MYYWKSKGGCCRDIKDREKRRVAIKGRAEPESSTGVVDSIEVEYSFGGVVEEDEDAAAEGG